MSNDATGADKAAADQNGADAQKTLGDANSGIADYMSNVNSRLAAGNPYESEDYLKKQNLETSGAMNSEKGALDEELGSTVARTGTNSAAIAATEADAARQGQRDLTGYNAGRDTANTDKWEQEKEGLTRDQLAGADAEGKLYGTATGAQSSNLNAYTTAEDAQDQMWAQLGEAAMTGAGAGLGGAYCWVAAELYGGWNDPRAVLVRNWMAVSLTGYAIGRSLLSLYVRFGPRVAEHIRTHQWSRWIMLVIFNRVLAAAQRKQGKK